MGQSLWSYQSKTSPILELHALLVNLQGANPSLFQAFLVWGRYRLVLNFLLLLLFALVFGQKDFSA